VHADHEAGDAATRGGFTSFDGAVSSRAWSNSLLPRGSDAALAFISSRSAQVAMLQTNSPVSMAKVDESFSPSLEKPTIGGLDEKALK
jgi:hypothetical protein